MFHVILAVPLCGRHYCHPHFTEEETEAKRAKALALGPAPHNGRMRVGFSGSAASALSTISPSLVKYLQCFH